MLQDSSSSMIGADMTEDEIISIEDTYRETQQKAAGDQTEELKNNSVQRLFGNRSMTIIEEEADEYEESSMLNQNLYSLTNKNLHLSQLQRSQLK